MKISIYQKIKYQKTKYVMNLFDTVFHKSKLSFG